MTNINCFVAFCTLDERQFINGTVKMQLSGAGLGSIRHGYSSCDS
jgi:hypothetical protein